MTYSTPENFSARLDHIVRHDPGVKEIYRHTPKLVSPLEPISLSGAFLKWYQLAPEAEPVPLEIKQLARGFLHREQPEARGLGFVILHRCGSSFYFLIVCTWRGNNEVWETVYYKDGDAMSDFALFPRDGTHKPAFCVWELAPVWHEKSAWERFLTSDRNASAAHAWAKDIFAGPV
jgi:hypothetical protein